MIVVVLVTLVLAGVCPAARCFIFRNSGRDNTYRTSRITISVSKIDCMQVSPPDAFTAPFP